MTTQEEDGMYYSYIGEFKSGQYHGKGQLKRLPVEGTEKTEGKFIYNGDFENSLKHGYGQMYWKPWAHPSEETI